MTRLALLALLFTACATEPDPDPIGEVADEISFPPEEELRLLVLQYCGMTRDGVTTYRGLTGTYQRLGLPAIDEPLRLSLVTTQEEPYPTGTFRGTYRAASGAAVPYAGGFMAIPDNPAIGAAFALDTDSDGENDTLYFVLAIRRSLGQVRGLCLAGSDHPFLLSRTLF